MVVSLTASRFGSKLDGQETYSHREWLVTFGQVVQEVKDEMKRQGREDEFVGAKVKCSLDQTGHSVI
jgi:hypothetical protein